MYNTMYDFFTLEQVQIQKDTPISFSLQDRENFSAYAHA